MNLSGPRPSLHFFIWCVCIVHVSVWCMCASICYMCVWCICVCMVYMCIWCVCVCMVCMYVYGVYVCIVMCKHGCGSTCGSQRTVLRAGPQLMSSWRQGLLFTSMYVRLALASQLQRIILFPPPISPECAGIADML